MTHEELSRFGSPLFASRASLDEALDYVGQLAAGSEDGAAMYTAVFVVINTIIKTLEEVPA